MEQRPTTEKSKNMSYLEKGQENKQLTSLRDIPENEHLENKKPDGDTPRWKIVRSVFCSSDKWIYHNYVWLVNLILASVYITFIAKLVRIRKFMIVYRFNEHLVRGEYLVIRTWKSAFHAVQGACSAILLFPWPFAFQFPSEKRPSRGCENVHLSRLMVAKNVLALLNVVYPIYNLVKRLFWNSYPFYNSSFYVNLSDFCVAFSVCTVVMVASELVWGFCSSERLDVRNMSSYRRGFSVIFWFSLSTHFTAFLVAFVVTIVSLRSAAVAA